jgi:hypothetical protein
MKEDELRKVYTKVSMVAMHALISSPKERPKGLTIAQLATAFASELLHRINEAERDGFYLADDEWDEANAFEEYDERDEETK